MKKILSLALIGVLGFSAPSFAAENFWLKAQDAPCEVYKTTFKDAKIGEVKILIGPLDIKGIQTVHIAYKKQLEQLEGSGHNMCIFFENAENRLKDTLPPKYVITMTPEQQ